MGETIEGFKYLEKIFKEEKSELQQSNNTIIINWCKSNGVLYRFINVWHVRIAKKTGKFYIDIFTQTKKYHNIHENKRGRIDGTITDFLNTNFL